MRVILTIISQSRIILEHYRSKACVVASCQNQRASEYLPIARADLSIPERDSKRQLAERSYDHKCRSSQKWHVRSKAAGSGSAVETGFNRPFDFFGTVPYKPAASLN